MPGQRAIATFNQHLRAAALLALGSNRLGRLGEGLGLLRFRLQLSGLRTLGR
jgi:hypothetical protein